LVRERPELIERYVASFPEVTIILDHCGMPATPAAFSDVLALARYKNLALKWCHAESAFPGATLPFREWDPYLRSAVDAFGAERIMWASDFTQIRGGGTWAESLFYLRYTPVLSATEREWILGRTVRTLLRWPAPTG